MLTCLAECVVCAVTIAIIVEKWAVQPFEAITTKPPQYIIFALLRCNFAGVVITILMFYGILHSLQNIFAELTRFADRLFYQVRK